MKVRMNRKAGRLIAWLMAVVMLLGTAGYCPVGSNVAEAADGEWPVWHGLTATSFAGGSGTKNDPYQIRWGSQLRLLAEKVNSGVSYTGTYFILTHDIILNDHTNVEAYIKNRSDWYKAASETAKAAIESELSQYIENKKVNVWESIGYYTSTENNRVFSGNFDGKGHTIKGLLSCTNSTNGLFGYVGSGAVIDNVDIDDSYIEGSGNGVGGVVGLNSGSVTNCTNNGTVVSVWLDGNRKKAGSSGGIVGVNNDTVANCSNTGNVYGVGSTGGVVGTNYKSVVNCSNEGKIGSNEEGYALVNGNMEAVKDYASIYGTGGIVGLNREVNSSIENSYNLGSVYASDNAGGIAGIAQGVIVNCYNNETVEADGNESYAGAIAGTLAYPGDTKKGNIVYSYWKQGVADDKLVACTGNAVLDDTRYCPYNADTRALIPNGGAANISVGDPAVNVNNLLDALKAWVAYKNDTKYSDWREGKTGLPVFGEAADDSWQGLGDSEKPVGAGTENNPYLISSGKNLNWVRANNLQLGTDSYLALTNDIKLNDETFKFIPDTGLVEVKNANNSVMYYGTGIKGEAGGVANFDDTPSKAGQWYDNTLGDVNPNENAGIHEWTPIGNEENAFLGHFDGRGYSISGVFVSSGNVSCWGLFGKINGEVSNLTISDSFIFSKEGDYAGGITGVLSGTVENCCTEKTIVMSSGQINKTTHEYTYTGCLGGITGKNEPGSTVDGCHIGTGALIIGTAEAVGGISGYNYGGKIINSYNEIGNNSEVEVIGKREAESYVGGIAGVNASEGKGLNGTPENPKPDIYGYIENCYDRGTVTGNDKAYVGGIAGYNLGGKINNVYADTTVSGGFTMNGVQCSGEIVGFNGDSIGKSDTVMGQTVVYYKPEKGIIADAYCAAGKNICGMPKDDSSKQEVDGGNVNTFKYSAASYTLNGADLFTRLNSWITSETETIYAPWKKASDADSHPVFGEKKAAPDEKIEKEPYPAYKITYMLNYEKNNAIFDGDQSYKDEDENDVYYHEISEYQLNPENDDTIAAGNDKLLQLGSDVRKGYILTSWNTKRDGSGDSFELGKATATEDFEAYFEANKCDITLYAQWKSTKAVIISATADDGNAVTITWDPVDKADGYWVYRWSDKEFPNTPFVDIETTSNKIHEADKNEYSVKDYEPYKNADLGAGTYRYGVMAYTKEGDSTIMFNPFSDYAEVVIENRSIVYNGNGSDGGAAAPTVGIQHTEVEVADNDNSYTRTGYGFTGWNTESDGSGTAYNAGDKVKLDDDVQLYALWRPSPVEGLVGNYNAVDNKIVLSWTSHEWPASYRNDNNITLGYNVYRSEDGVDYTPYKTIAHKFDDRTVGCEEQLEVKPDENKSYWYKVVAYKTEKKGVSTFTEESTPETIEVPVTVNSKLELDKTKGRQDPEDDTKCTGIDGTTVYMKWEAANGATGYELYRSTDKNDYGTLHQTIDTGDITCSDEVPGAGTYYYYVRPYTEIKDANGYSVSKAYDSFSKVLIVTISEVKVTYNINITGKDVTKDDAFIKDCEYTILSSDADLLKDEFKNDGYTLEKWNTLKDQTGDTYEFGDKTTFPDDTELFAVWKINPPTDLVSAVKEEQLVLSWTQNASAESYQIFVKKGEEEWSEDPVDTVKASATEPTLTYNAGKVNYTYQYRIKAVDTYEPAPGSGILVSKYSDYAYFPIVAAADAGQVTGLKCSIDKNDASNVDVVWNAPEDAVTGYYIYRTTNEGAPTKDDYIDTVTQNGTEAKPYIDSSIDEPGTYYYYVRAYLEDNDGQGDDGIYYKTFSEPAKIVLEPVTITYKYNKNTSKQVTIIKESGDVKAAGCDDTPDGYTFDKWTGTINDEEVEYEIGQAIPADKLNKDITLTARWKLNAPENVSPTLQDDKSSVEITWDSLNGAAGYIVYRSKTGEAGPFTELATVTGTTYTDNNDGKVIGKDDNYYYCVKGFEQVASDTRRLGEASDPEPIIIPGIKDDQVVGVACEVNPDGDGKHVRITWDPVDGATGYYVYRSNREDSHGSRINDGKPVKSATFDDLTIAYNEPGEYYYFVRAYQQDDDSLDNAVISYKPFSDYAKAVLEPVTITYKNGKDTYPVTVIKESDGVTAREALPDTANYVFLDWNGTINDEPVYVKPGDAISSDKLKKDVTLNSEWMLKAVTLNAVKSDDGKSIVVSWPNNKNATGYDIFWKIDGSNYPEIANDSTKSSASNVTYTIRDIDRYSKYWIRVVPYEDILQQSGQGMLKMKGESSEIDVKADEDFIPDGMVTNFAAVKEYDADNNVPYIRFTWTPLNDASGYYIYKSTDPNKDGDIIVDINNDDTPEFFEDSFYEDRSQFDVGSYYYKIRAYKKTASALYYQPFSEQQTVTFEPLTITYMANNTTNVSKEEVKIKGLKVMTADCDFIYDGKKFMSWNTEPDGKGYEYQAGEYTDIAEDTTLYAMWKLDAPINVEAALQDDNSTVDITWNALDGADGYLVYRRIGDAGDYVEIGTVKEPKYSDVNEGSEPGKNAPYYYKVKAYEQIEADIRRLSEYSEAAVIKQDGADAKEGQVTNLKAKVNKATEVSLTWNKVDGAAGYYVYRTDSEQFGGETYFADVTPAKSGDTPAAAYTDSSITSDMPDTYYYYVRAYTKDDNGVYYKPISDPCKVVLEAVTITYNANGGTGNNKVDTVVKGSSNISVRTVDECNIKRAGYSFEGWYGTIGGKDKLYAAGEVFAADDLADNIVLNAKWTLEAVANFTATKDAENDSIVKLNWTANSQATGYYIYRRNGENGTPENYMTVKKGEKLPISFTLSDEEKKNTYYYAVKPFVELEDPITGIITVSVGNETDYLEPGGLALSGQVKDFKAEASNGDVNLSWAAVKDASGYYIYKSTTDNKYGDPYVTIKSGDTEEYTDPGDDEGFKLGTTYYYKIRAYVEKADDTGIEYKPLSDKAEVRFESYTIIYNANIPNIADKDKTKNIDYIKGVNATTLAKSELPISWIYPGRTLVGWNTKEDGTGSLYYAGTEYEVITADNNTVYAVWRLEAPTGVTAELQDDNSTVNITWNPVLGAQGYFIYKKDIKTGAREELGMSKDTSYIDKNEHELGEDEGYYYEVRAYEEVGDSDNRIKRMSDYSEDTPEASVGDTEPVPDTSLGSVTNLTLIGFEGNNAKIGWSGIPKADGYFVYRSIGADGKKEYTGIDVTGNNAYTGELTVNTPYYYYVVAYIMDTINDSRILGNYSEGISVMVTASPAPTSTPSPTPSPTPNPLGKVSNLTVVSTTAGTAELNWDALYNVDGYKIYYSYDEQMEDKVQNVDVTGTTHIIEELPVGSTVYFKVRGYELKIGDGLMYSDYSDTVSVEIFGATPSPAPTAIPTDTPVPTAEPAATPDASGTPSSAEPTGNPGDATATPSTEPGQSTQEPTSEPGTSTTAPTTEPGTPTTEPGTPTETPTAEPVTPTETPTAEPGTPTEAPTTEPTAAPATEAPTIAPVPDDPRLVHRFFVKDAYNQYINLIWDKAPAAIGYEISYATTLDGVKTVIATPDKDADSMQALPVTGAAFTVNENINASEIQAYNQRANATYYYFIRSKLENSEYGNYSSAIMIALHSSNYVTPVPNISVTPGPVTQSTPTPVPIQAPDDKEMVSVGDKITKSKLVYKITANTEVSHTVKVMKPVKKTYKSITIPATVTIEGVKFKVTAINKNAFSKNKKLQKLYIGKNVKTIGSKAFYKCSKLKNLVFKGKKVTKIGTYAFKGINKDCQIVIPKAVLKKYKKLIKGSTKKS